MEYIDTEYAVSDEIDDEPEIQYPDYSELDFLNEVYINADKYATLRGLLLRKKNVILQGAPGVAGRVRVNSISPGWIDTTDTSNLSQADIKQQIYHRQKYHNRWWYKQTDDISQRLRLEV